jgi:hypothetical protein
MLPEHSIELTKKIDATFATIGFLIGKLEKEVEEIINLLELEKLESSIAITEDGEDG